ncbi:hypothetical protein C8Q74DRAFT_1258859 [Fomes fomentarius]|nr:hypothetical protein C8Q74DRAFT_1258859 [Fomes fomentarius]
MEIHVCDWAGIRSIEERISKCSKQQRQDKYMRSSGGGGVRVQHLDKRSMNAVRPLSMSPSRWRDTRARRGKKGPSSKTASDLDLTPLRVNLNEMNCCVCHCHVPFVQEMLP